MCIRDRYYKLVGKPMKTKVITVSYTHLDVYKRQGVTWPITPMGSRRIHEVCLSLIHI